MILPGKLLKKHSTRPLNVATKEVTVTREEVSRAIYWPRIIWSFGFINIAAMAPQLIQIIRTRETEGLAIGMFFIYLGVQIAFSLEGFFTRNRMLMVCLGLSAMVTTIIIALVTYLRYFQ